MRKEFGLGIVSLLIASALAWAGAASGVSAAGADPSVNAAVISRAPLAVADEGDEDDDGDNTVPLTDNDGIDTPYTDNDGVDTPTPDTPAPTPTDSDDSDDSGASS